jgi:hypothetical protein
MKKPFTFLAAVALMTSAAIAQKNSNYQNSNKNCRDVAVNDKNYGRGGYDDRGKAGYYFSEREKNMQLEHINRVYDNKIRSVRNRFFMSRYQKERAFASLQFQRSREIRSVMARFNSRENRYDRKDNGYNDHDKRNW